MPNINKANRQVCDVDIRDIATKKPFLFLDTANTTTQNITGDAAYAMAKGARKISFANPIGGTAQISCQVYPFELYSLMTDGIVETTAMYAVKKTIEATTAGQLTIPTDATAGTVFAFASGEFGGEEIKGEFASNTFTADTASEIVVGESYEVGYMISKTSGVKKLSFNNKKLPKAYYISMDTVEKDEDENLTAYKIILWKAQAQRNFELSQSSEGDPATLTMTFDLLEDKDGNFVDMVEITDDESGN